MQLLRFTATSLINTLSGYIVYLLLFPRISYVPAYLASFLFCLSFSFLSNSLVVFKSKPGLSRFLFTLALHITYLVLATSLLYIMVNLAGLNKAIAPLAIAAMLWPLTFIANRCIFRQTLS